MFIFSQILKGNLERTNKIILYSLLIIIVIASYFVKRIDIKKRFIPISGTDNYYYINVKRKDTIIIDKKYLPK